MGSLTLPSTARPEPSIVAGPIIGGWKLYLNPLSIVLMEVWRVSNGFQVIATLSVTDRDGQPIQKPISRPYDDEAEAGGEMDRLAVHLFAVMEPIKRPEPLPGPA